MKNLFVVAIFLGWFAAPAWGGYEKDQGMPQEYVRAYTFAAQQGRKVSPPNRKPLPPGWILVAGEWKIAE